MEKLVLFDIDGTILLTRGAGRRAIRQALLDMLGTTGPIEGHRFDGKTDPQIVMELMELATPPIEIDPERVTAVCKRYTDLLAIELEAENLEISVLPGVNDLMDELDRQSSVLLGLLTGNVVEGAHLKLRRAGIDPGRFRVGAFGSDSHLRHELPAFAVERAEQIAGRKHAGEAVVIIGDTPADMTCGQAVGARAIGVTTGSYSASDLEAAGAYAVFESLGDVEAVSQAILS